MSNTPTGWQPIETAPRDGTIILLWDAHYNRVVSSEWDTNEDYLCWSVVGHYGAKACKKPTHWMPTPVGPTAGDTMSDMPTKTYPPESVQRMIDDHVGDITKKGDAMSENTNPDTRTLLTRDTIKHLAERCDLNRIIGPLSLVNADEWDYLLTFTHRAIDAAGVEQLMRERDEARADVERLKALIICLSRPIEGDSAWVLEDDESEAIAAIWREKEQRDAHEAATKGGRDE